MKFFSFVLSHISRDKIVVLPCEYNSDSLKHKHDLAPTDFSNTTLITDISDHCTTMISVKDYGVIPPITSNSTAVEVREQY